MSSTNRDIKSAPDLPANAPYVPSAVEAELYLYGLYSMPRLIARSSLDTWIKPTGLRANFERKELGPLCAHRLDEVWEDTVGPAMSRYLVKKQVQWTSVNPLRIGIEGQPFSAVILIGVKPGTLSPELGLETAVGCRSILVQSNIDDIHIIISEPTCTDRPVTGGPAYDPPATGSGPYVPSEGEAMYYLHGLPSEARFIARSSPDIWVKWRGSDGYLERKELSPLGTHRLSGIWEDTVGPAMHRYLVDKQVQWTSFHPLRIGVAGQPSPSAVILVGVKPGTLSHELGIGAALDCRSILLQNDIDDIHVIICESIFTRSTALYKPIISMSPSVAIRERFSTTLGIPIWSGEATNLQGTGGFFFTDAANPGTLYLITARHVLFDLEKEKNELYTFRKDSGQASREVVLMNEATFEAHCKAIESVIDTRAIRVELFNERLAGVDEIKDQDQDHVNRLRETVRNDIKKTEREIARFKKLLADVTRDWADKSSRIIGHIVLSPPISFNASNDGFTKDWAVIEIHPSAIAKLNFVGNAINLGCVEISELTSWMYSRSDNMSPFEYPGGGLLRFSGTVSDQEMFRLDPNNKDHDNDPVMTVLKNGSASNLTVGRLNTIRAFLREDFQGVPGQMSREVAVLSRNSESGPFSKAGDSGSVVIDGIGRVCGILSGGTGAYDASDCTFVTSINSLTKRLAAFGVQANIFPLPRDL